MTTKRWMFRRLTLGADEKRGRLNVAVRSNRLLLFFRLT